MDASVKSFSKELESKPLVVFYQDEARFGRLSNEAKCWVQSKMVPTVKSQFIREYIYVFSALSAQTGDCYSIISPLCNTDAMNKFLESMCMYYNQFRIVMIMDKAGWHTSSTLVLPQNLAIINLPPYSPELNPVELLWREIRRKHFHNEWFENLNLVEAKLCQILKQLHSDKDQIKRLSNGYNLY